MEGTQAERPEGHPSKAFVGERAIQRQGHAVVVPVGSLGKEEEDGLLLEAAKRELEHEGRRAVEPLHVVDRDHEGGGACEGPQHAEERE